MDTNEHEFLGDESEMVLRAFVTGLVRMPA